MTQRINHISIQIETFKRSFSFIYLDRIEIRIFTFCTRVIYIWYEIFKVTKNCVIFPLEQELNYIFLLILKYLNNLFAYFRMERFDKLILNLKSLNYYRHVFKSGVNLNLWFFPPLPIKSIIKLYIYL